MSGMQIAFDFTNILGLAAYASEKRMGLGSFLYIYAK